MKMMRILLLSPLFLSAVVCMVMWPIGLLIEVYQFWSLYQLYKADPHAVGTWALIAFHVWVTYFIIRMPMFVRKAIWVQFVEKYLMCCKGGKMLQIAQTSETSSDVILDDEFVTTRWGRRVVNVIGQHHIRRSIDMTLTDAMNSGAHGPISSDDVLRPNFFLTGTGDASVADYNELWTSHASMASWPSLYAWCPSLRLLTTSIPLEEDTTVLGYVHLLQTSEPIPPERYTTRFAPCMGSSPCFMRDDQVIARRWYWVKNQFGNFPRGLPDAFIFKKGSTAELGLKTIYTFRVCVKTTAPAQV